MISKWTIASPVRPNWHRHPYGVLTGSFNSTSCIDLSAKKGEDSQKESVSYLRMAPRPQFVKSCLDPSTHSYNDLGQKSTKIKDDWPLAKPMAAVLTRLQRPMMSTGPIKRPRMKCFLSSLKLMRGHFVFNCSLWSPYNSRERQQGDRYIRMCSQQGFALCCEWIACKDFLSSQRQQKHLCLQMKSKHKRAI